MTVEDQFHPKLGILYGIDPKIEQLAKKFVGHLNNNGFCNACEELEQKVICSNCRENLESFANNIYFYKGITDNIPQYIDNPEIYFPKDFPSLDYLVIFGIHRDLLVGLPEYLRDKNIKAVIIPIEDPRWVPPGLQKQVLDGFERWGIQAVFPKPFCTLNIQEDEHNKIGFNITKRFNHIIGFINYFKIGRPKISLKLSENGRAIEESSIIRSAPCGSTYYIIQQLKRKYIKNGGLDLSLLYENISKAHSSYPCVASMQKDHILNDSIFCIGDNLIKSEILNALDHERVNKYKSSCLVNPHFS